MSDFMEQLRLAEKAAEDVYFARVDRELIKSLHERTRAGENSFRPSGQSRVGARAGDSQFLTNDD